MEVQANSDWLYCIFRELQCAEPARNSTKKKCSSNLQSLVAPFFPYEI